LHPKKGSGHDLLSSCFIKQINDATINPISLILNRSLSEGVVPSAMKTEKVIAIYKSKDKEHLSNYRQIILLPGQSTINAIVEFENRHTKRL